jgi:hypothetical protein
MANDLRTKLADTLEKQYLAALDAASVRQDMSVRTVIEGGLQAIIDGMG